MLAQPRCTIPSDVSSQREADALKLYFWTWRLVFAAGMLLLISMGYVGSFLFLNNKGFDGLDPVITALTHAGDAGIAGALLVLVGWRRKPQWVILGLLALIGSGLLAQVGKNLLFSDWQRPLALLSDGTSFRYTLSEPLRLQSFPSGHATSCAAVGWYLALIFPRNTTAIGLALAVWVVMLTRVYVGAHFLGDVLAGGALGTGTAALIYFAFRKRIHSSASLTTYLSKSSNWLNPLLAALSLLVMGGLLLVQYI
jgi:undecaprenyl-diphosphatase